MQLLLHIALLATLLCAGGLSVRAQDLTALEQRTEGLRAQLRAVTDKEAALQGRLRQLDEELKPENIQNRAPLTGVLNVDAARAQVRKQIEGEQARLRQQLDLLATSRAHLETAISEAEAETVRRRAAALAPPQVETPAPQPAVVAQPSAPRRRAGRRRPARRGRARKPVRRVQTQER